ncbi:MAG TPA: hypothetical protein VK914_13430 [bacterium]|jgi:hypothetical protein|nr:hypothetical protein [bacterium]
MSDTLPPDPPGTEGHADDIVEVATYEAKLPRKREFLPWHLPRKQFVRQKQWCKQISLMLDEHPLADSTLKYMGLPGIDLLDLRHFHSEICVNRNIGLRFLGFNSSAVPTDVEHTELNVSLDEVRRLSGVDPMSNVIGDNFALVARENSIASRKTLELGPFDVINLDLCDGFGSQTPGALEQTYYDAINSLLSLQARTKSPWLLLLTTRTDRANVNIQVLQSLIEIYNRNLDSCTSFREASLDKFAIETAEALRAAAGTEGGLLAVFLVGLCKWLLRLALAHQPPTSVELRSVIGYRVNRGSEHGDLFSLALRFTPTFAPITDPSGLANRPSTTPNECNLSTQVLNRVASRVDADKVLAENPEIKQAMTDATASLLVLARYDEEAYRAWLP